MPVVQIHRCPVCGTETDEGELGLPVDWILLQAGGESEPFDRWECVRSYAVGKDA